MTLITAQVQQLRAYIKSRSIEPVDGVCNSYFIVPFVPLSFRLISCSFVNVLARIQYKYTRKLGSTVVNCPAKPSVRSDNEL